MLDGNRVYARLGFVRPDGSIHTALAFVDMGSSEMLVTEALSKELHLGGGSPLRFAVGDFRVGVPGDELSGERWLPHSLGPSLMVEALLPAGVLQHYDVRLDYGKRTLTLGEPGTLAPLGVRVPVRINPATGLIVAEASIAGRSYPMTLDNGSAYTWVRGSIAKPWLAEHPLWQRGIGAVGPSNMMMSGDGTERLGRLLRVPAISLGSLTLENVGILATGPSRVLSGGADLFDWYSRKNPVPVIGWLGGNVFNSFRVTLDYPNRVTYWERETAGDVHELDQVGLTLRFRDGTYFVAAVATKNERPAVRGVLPGDRLIRIGSLETRGASWGSIYAAMHGRPGERRVLLLERKGHRLTANAAVTAF